MWSTVGFRIAQAMGITGAAWLSGNIALFSMNVIPSLLRSRTETDLPLTTLVTQWREIYETGKRQNPAIAGLTAASFVYLAVFSRKSSSSSSSSPLLLFRGAPPYSRAGLYASAALLTLSIVPFTLIAMSSTNNALIDVCESQKQRGTGAAGVATDARIEELLQDWVALNRVRSLLPLLASLTGIVVALL
ncbi:hypothetical protein BJX66DRAFT_332310 [Aspergillus keveii]|uniref:DUF1772-domain-containing protein n=1 Tax=Aspergillus keveii TaxID=714993 RepID=A0ABR4GMA3_9EURO